MPKHASPLQALQALCNECSKFQSLKLLSGSYATRPVKMAAIDRTGKFNISLAADSATVEIEFFGYIGGWDGISARQFIADVKKVVTPKVKNIVLLINSGGGDVFEATAIYSFLIGLEQTVHAKVIGVAASAATEIAMAADSVSMAANAYWMVHGVRGGIYGTTAEIRDYLKLLDDANEAAHLIFRTRTGLSDAKVTELLSKDSWLTPEEAKELGFIDSIDPITKVKPHVKPKAALKFNFDATEKHFDRLFAHAEVERLVASLPKLRTDPDDDEDDDDEEEEGESDLDSKTNHKSAAGSKSTVLGHQDGKEKESEMNFAAWLKANGLPEEKDLSPEYTAVLKSMYTKGIVVAGVPVENTTPPGPDAADKAAAARLRRHAAIQAKCGVLHSSLAADAIEKGWDDERLDVELRAAKAEAAVAQQATDEGEQDFGSVFNIHVKDGKPTADAAVLSVALSLSAGVSVDDLLNPYAGMTRAQQLKIGVTQPIKPATEKQIELAQTHFPGIGLQEVILQCNRFNNADQSQTWRGDESIRASYQPPKAAFSTVSVPLILRDAVDRSIIAGYKKAEPKWNQIAGVESLRDFKATDKYRVFGTGSWEKVGETGELKHGQIEAAPSYKMKLETEGQIMIISREMIINNDVGSISDIGESMAFYGRLGPEFALFKLINAAYATVGNVFPFTYPDLEALWIAWIKQTQYDTGVKKDTGRGLQVALDMEPAIVLVNKIHEISMRHILYGTQAVVGGGATPQIVSYMNALEGSLKVVASSYFYYNAATPNLATIAIMPGPNMMPAFKVGFLNGRQLPYIQNVDPAPDRLGFGVRGWLDFCVSQTEAFLVATQEDVV